MKTADQPFETVNADSTTKKDSRNKAAPEKLYKVRVGSYFTRNRALAASEKLRGLGYSTYVQSTGPFSIQVGAFRERNYAERLKRKLSKKGYGILTIVKEK